MLSYAQFSQDISFHHDIKNIRMEHNVPMKRCTSFRVGGPADYFAKPSSIAELTNLISYADKNKIPYTVIGGGTNILVKDKGIRGLVISLLCMKNQIEIVPLSYKYVGIAEHVLGLKQSYNHIFDKFEGSGNFPACNDNLPACNGNNFLVSASAGTILAALCKKTMNLGLEDLSFAAGIPGSLGGAVMMNAGTNLGTISDYLVSIDILDKNNNIKTLSRAELKFSHRKLEFLNEYGLTFKPIIVKISFLLTRGNKEKIKKSWSDLMEKRRISQPHGIPSAGCFFKNPDPEISGSKSAGQLIDMAGLKKKRVGDAMVSDKHANFILNLGNADAKDIIALKEIVKERVFKKFAVNLSEEVIIKGE